MKIISLTVLLAMSTVLSVQAQSEYDHELMLKRDSINVEFEDSATSILPSQELETFNGLNFYAPNETYKVDAKFRRAKGKPFEMQTSTNRLPIYQKYGRLDFRIDGKKCRLFLYENVRKTGDTSLLEYVFCPFKDLSNLDSTYGGGRYLDFKVNELSKSVTIDFNLCYNPYCAYNNRYSCPIPPKENTLDVRVDAGVKKWHE